MYDQLVEQLLAVQIDRAAAHLPPKDGDAVLAAKIHVHLLLDILEIAEAEVGRAGREQVQPFAAQARQGVVQELRVLPWDGFKTIKLHLVLLLVNKQVDK